MRIVSWNIQWGRGADGCVDLQRTVSVLRALDPDLICLQEVAENVHGLAGATRVASVEMVNEGFPGYASVFGPALERRQADGRMGSFGNLILSRLPLRSVRRHSLPWPADAKAPSMPRACLEVELESPRPLRVLTTHLEYYSALIRNAQAKALRQCHIDSCARARQPPPDRGSPPLFDANRSSTRAVLCGDFNCEPAAAAWQILTDTKEPDAWHDAWQVLHPGQTHAPTVGLHGAEWPDRQYCCDFVFVSDALRSELRAIQVESTTAASDHQPVIVELEDGG